MRRMVALGATSTLALAISLGAAQARPAPVRHEQVVTPAKVLEVIQTAESLQTTMQRRVTVTVGGKQERIGELLGDGSDSLAEANDLLQNGNPKLLRKALKAAQTARARFQAAQNLMEDAR